MAQVGRHYDDLDLYYRELWGEHVHHGLWLTGEESPEEAVEQLVKRVAELALLERGQRVCDVGCGYGAPARFLAEQHGVHVVGFTVSEAQHAFARTRETARTRFLLRDWMENDLDDASQDAVIAIESISHMPDKERFFAEARRVLRPGGRLVMSAWLTREAPSAWARRHLLEPICREGRLPGLASAGEYRKWMTAAGFTGVVHHDVTEEVKRTWSICLRRVAVRLLTDPGFLSFFAKGPWSGRAFGRAVLRIYTAYRLGAMEYGLFEGRATGNLGARAGATKPVP